jgi:hypothetical protein
MLRGFDVSVYIKTGQHGFDGLWKDMFDASDKK